jgi:hypothetical protein
MVALASAGENRDGSYGWLRLRRVVSRWRYWSVRLGRCGLDGVASQGFFM